MTSKMTINKYQGKTKEEAIEKAKQELGEGAVVMNVKEIKPTGMFKAWKSSVFEVTAAREEKESFVDPRQMKISVQKNFQMTEHPTSCQDILRMCRNCTQKTD